MRKSSIALLLVVAGHAHAGPGELTLLSVNSLQDVMTDVLARFEKETGQTVAVSYANPSQLKAKLRGTEHPDVVLASEESMNGLVDQTQSSSRSTLGRVGLGVVVKHDAKAPDLSSAASFRQALIDARSLIYVDPQQSADGAKARAVVDKLGLGDSLKAKTQFGSGANAIAPVGFGNVDMGLHPIHQILAARDVKLAGPVPPELQQWTRYDLALTADPPNPGEAQRLVQYLRSATARSALQSKGVEGAP